MNKPHLTLAVVCSAKFAKDSVYTIVVVALPTIAAELNVSELSAAWVLLTPMLVNAALVPACGALADATSRRRVWLFGFLLNLLGLVVCGVADSLGVLILGRGILGIGGALDDPSGFGMAANAFPPSRRGLPVGALSSMGTLAPALGIVIGGLVLDHVNWRWMFLAPVPFIVAILILAVFVLPSDDELELVEADTEGRNQEGTLAIGGGGSSNSSNSSSSNSSSSSRKRARRAAHNKKNKNKYVHLDELDDDDIEADDLLHVAEDGHRLGGDMDVDTIHLLGGSSVVAPNMFFELDVDVSQDEVDDDDEDLLLGGDLHTPLGSGGGGDVGGDWDDGGNRDARDDRLGRHSPRQIREAGASRTSIPAELHLHAVRVATAHSVSGRENIPHLATKSATRSMAEKSPYLSDRNVAAIDGSRSPLSVSGIAPPELPSKANRLKYFDWLGSLLVAVAASCLLFGINQMQTLGPDSPAIIVSIIVAVLATWLFVRQERRAGMHALMPLVIFQDPIIVSSILSRFLLLAAYMGAFVLFPFALTEVQGFSLRDTSFIVFIRPAIFGVISLFASKLSSLKARDASGRVILLGSFFLSTSLLVYCFFSRSSPLPLLLGALALQGAALGVSSPVNMVIVTNRVPSAMISTISAVISLLLSVSETFGIAVALAVMSWEGGTADASAYRVSFLVLFLVAVCGTLVSVYLWRLLVRGVPTIWACHGSTLRFDRQQNMPNVEMPRLDKVDNGVVEGVHVANAAPPAAAAMATAHANVEYDILTTGPPSATNVYQQEMASLKQLYEDGSQERHRIVYR